MGDHEAGTGEVAVQRTRIDWVAEQSKLLRGIAEEFARTQPFKGLTIGTGIHLEAKTVALLLTLQAGGAKLVSTGNLNTTQADAVERLRAHGVPLELEPSIRTGARFPIRSVYVRDPDDNLVEISVRAE
mgnify:CR=1 FL=1